MSVYFFLFILFRYALVLLEGVVQLVEQVYPSYLVAGASPIAPHFLSQILEITRSVKNLTNKYFH
jgi:hypothetical protein